MKWLSPSEVLKENKKQKLIIQEKERRLTDLLEGKKECPPGLIIFPCVPDDNYEFKDMEGKRWIFHKDTGCWMRTHL